MLKQSVNPLVIELDNKSHITVVSPIDKLRHSEVLEVVLSAHEHLIKFSKRKQQTIYFRSKDRLLIDQFISVLSLDPESLEQPMEWLSTPSMDVNFKLKSGEIISLGVFNSNGLRVPGIGDVEVSDRTAFAALLKHCFMTYR